MRLKIFLVGLATVLWLPHALAQTGYTALPGLTLQSTSKSGNLVGATVLPPGGAVALPLSATIGSMFNPASYGAFGDGQSHTVQATLGITTAAGLANYAVNGVYPYAFFNTEPFGVRFALDPAVNTATGSNTINFAGAGVVGVQVANTSAIASTSTSFMVADLAVTADQTPIAVGSTVSASCLPAGDTVQAVSGSVGNYTITLAAPATGACASGTFLKFGVSPAANSYVLPVTFASGVRQGDLVTGPACLQAGTQVDEVNPAKMEIRLSLPTAAVCPQNAALTFIPSWLTNVTPGMKVEGLAGVFVNNATVTSVNATSGVVTINPPLAANLVAATNIRGNPSQANLNTQVVFWRPYTDIETANLQIDRLAWQAAINNLSPVTGGQVAGNPGTYRLDAPLILPISPTYVSGTRPNISISGIPESGISAVFLQMTKDTGPHTAAISCGDPVASAQNQLGIFQGLGYFCQGELHDLAISGVSYTGNSYGLRPKWNGTPVAMDGIKQGPRLDMARVTVQGFNNGLRIAADHTRWDFVVAGNNFVGFYFDDAQAGLYGDEYMSNVYSSGNGFAGISISARSFLNGQFDKLYLGFNPYAIYLEASVAVSNATQLTGATFTNLNAESSDCGLIKDGNLAEGYLPSPGLGQIFDTEFVSGYYATDTASVMLGGCKYNAAFDVGAIAGLHLRRIDNGAFTPVAGEIALIRSGLYDAHYGANNGGGTIEGDAGLWDLLQAFSAANIPMITGYGSQGQDGVFYTGGLFNWRLKGAGWRGTPMQVQYNTATSYKLGQVMEYGNGVSGNNGTQTIQFAGTTANSPVAGTIITPSAPLTGTPFSNSFVPIICTGGMACPVLTTAAPAQGTMLKVGTTTPGTAVVASGTTDTGNGTGPIGIITRVNGSNQAGLKALWLGAE